MYGKVSTQLMCIQLYMLITVTHIVTITIICDWIWENVRSSHIRFYSFGDSYKPREMVYRHETFRGDKGIVALQSLKFSHVSIIPNRFYESPKLKNWMCELCMFSQIRSHIQLCSCTSANMLTECQLFNLTNAYRCLF